MVKILPLFVARFLIATGLINLMTSYYKYAHKSLADTLDELTDNMELKSVLSYCFGDYGECYHIIIYMYCKSSIQCIEPPVYGETPLSTVIGL